MVFLMCTTHSIRCVHGDRGKNIFIGVGRGRLGRGGRRGWVDGSLGGLLDRAGS